MQRREFITLLGGAAAAWPLSARAQQPSSLVGVLHSGSHTTFAPLMIAFRRGLQERGFIDGQNATIDYRWAENQYDRLPVMAAELVHRQPAAKAATSTIPIVFTTGEDPVKAGLVDSLNRPGGNVTGVSLFYVELGAKRLEVLHELMPKAKVIGLLVNPRSPQGIGSNTEAEEQELDARTAVNTMGRQLIVVRASSESEINEAFAALVQQRAAGLIVASDLFLTTRMDQLIMLAARHAMPTVYPWRGAVTAGGLASYGIDLADSYRQVGGYVGRILKGAKPAELPVLQPTKFSLAINLQTAKTLGLEVPQTILVRADEVIE
jgi:putative ABC transport system substrate-binding protein